MKIGDTFRDDTPEREALAEEYRSKTKGIRDEQLWKARGDLVAKYWKHPSSWPDGIDSKYDRWYREGDWEWDDKMVTCVRRSVTESVTESEGVTDSVTIAKGLVEAHMGPLSSAEKQKRYRERLKEAKRVLREAEGKGGAGAGPEG